MDQHLSKKSRGNTVFGGPNHHVLGASREIIRPAAALPVLPFTERECRRCPNSTANPTVTVGENGLCNVCAAYKAKFNRQALRRELQELKSFIGTGQGKYDLLVGLSGGKDSSAMLMTVKEMDFTPLAFTLDSGYYPRHIFKRAAAVAKHLGVDHIRIPIAKYARAVDRKCFEMTASLYDLPETAENATAFRQAYQRGREHYSVNALTPSLSSAVASCVGGWWCGPTTVRPLSTA